MGGAIQTGLSLPLVTPPDRSQLRDCREVITFLAICTRRMPNYACRVVSSMLAICPSPQDAVRVAGKSD